MIVHKKAYMITNNYDLENKQFIYLYGFGGRNIYTNYKIYGVDGARAKNLERR